MRQGKLARKSRVSRQAVNSALAWLVDAGMLRLLEQGAKRGSANRYRLVMPRSTPSVYQANDDPEDDEMGVNRGDTPVNHGDRGVSTGATGVSTGATHNPRRTQTRTQEEPKRSAGKPTEQPKRPKGPPDEVTTAAHAIITEWWEERAAEGNPVGQPFIACKKVVAGMLRQGVKPTRLSWALRHSPVVSTAALELAIQSRLQNGHANGRSKGRRAGFLDLAAEVYNEYADAEQEARDAAL